MIKGKRDISLDLARTIAVMLIVLTHVVEASIDPKAIIDREFSLYKLISFSFFTISRLGVPLFLFISGQLILNKNFHSDKSILQFYLHNLLRIIVDAWCWIFVYHIFLTVCLGQDLGVINLLKSLFFLEEQPLMVHMWYIPMIIGYYLIMPFLAIIAKKFSAKILLIPFISFLVAVMVIPTIMGNITETYNSLLFVTYVIYFLLGFWSSQGKFNKIPTWLCVFASLLLLILAIIYQLFLAPSCIWYDHPFIVFSAFFLFLLIKRTNVKDKTIFAKAIRTTSKISFQIYFLHMILILSADLLLSRIISNMYIKCAVLGVIVFVLSWITSFIFVKIKETIDKKFKVKKRDNS